MSWGGSESASEVNWYDPYFTSYGIVYLAAGGDSSDAVDYPSASPNVVSCGGTSVNRSSTGAFISETGWSDTGCGLSVYEARPAYQSGISKIVGTHRGVPDLSFDSNPVTGVWVWDSNYFETLGGGWFVVGGTSVASPNLAGVVNRAGGFAASSNAELTKVYANKAITTDYSDTTLGFCGPYAGYLAVAGWDP